MTTAADDAGDCSNVECTHSHGFADGRCVLSGCEQPPVDDAGEVAAIVVPEGEPNDWQYGYHAGIVADRPEVAKVIKEYADARDVARAEVDSLRAEIERLTEQRGQAWEREGNAMARAHTAEADADSLRVTLAAVESLADRWAMVERRGAELHTHSEVSLADVREECEHRNWLGDGSTQSCTRCGRTEAVTDHG